MELKKKRTVDSFLAIYRGVRREKVNFLVCRLKIFLAQSHSRDVIRQGRKFYNVYPFDFFICSPAPAQRTDQFSSLNVHETKPGFLQSSNCSMI